MSLAVSSQTHWCRLLWNIVASLQPGLSNFFIGFHSDCVGVEWFLAVVLALPTLPSMYPLPMIHQCDGCLELGLMAGLWGFASHVGSILSRGCLATVEAPGSPSNHLQFSEAAS